MVPTMNMGRSVSTASLDTIYDVFRQRLLLEAYRPGKGYWPSEQSTPPPLLAMCEADFRQLIIGAQRDDAVLRAQGSEGLAEWVRRCQEFSDNWAGVSHWLHPGRLSTELHKRGIANLPVCTEPRPRGSPGPKAAAVKPRARKFMCTVCNVECNSLTQYHKSHVKGGTHIQGVRAGIMRGHFVQEPLPVPIDGGCSHAYYTTDVPSPKQSSAAGGGGPPRRQTRRGARRLLRGMVATACLGTMFLAAGAIPTSTGGGSAAPDYSMSTQNGWGSSAPWLNDMPSARAEDDDDDPEVIYISPDEDLLNNTWSPPRSSSAGRSQRSLQPTAWQGSSGLDLAGLLEKAYRDPFGGSEQLSKQWQDAIAKLRSADPAEAAEAVLIATQPQYDGKQLETAAALLTQQCPTVREAALSRLAQRIRSGVDMPESRSAGSSEEEEEWIGEMFRKDLLSYTASFYLYAAVLLGGQPDMAAASRDLEPVFNSFSVALSAVADSADFGHPLTSQSDKHVLKAADSLQRFFSQKGAQEGKPSGLSLGAPLTKLMRPATIAALGSAVDAWRSAAHP
eukprot:TRINITY_DN19413_c0_g1_i1.p1 TRINITY_DN19413_c0_g1~~TRINITY_DN19413_c0_g1_i1.p1  ORF type:complete len:597 (+),score=177.95 TRINITY_DN19413_c0_g1_i1:107-1792(+)